MIHHNVFELQEALGNIKATIEQNIAFENRIKTARGVEYYLTCHFDATENFVWVANVYLKIDVEPIQVRPDFVDDKIYVDIAQYTVGDVSVTPSMVYEKMLKYQKMHNCELRFNPTEWVLQVESNARMNWWKEVPS